jgi:tRNA pseudouridine38-40 synthase
LKNYKLLIQYDGTEYAGWQIQENCKTVQKTITDAIELLLKEKINLIGSGRTDSGVHAAGQVANFRTNNLIDIYRFKHSLNSVLPFDISIKKMEEVSEDFHSRFDAKRRVYFYLISKTKNPFFRNFSYFYHKEIDLAKLNYLSKIIAGTNDFTSFSRKNSEVENKICTVYQIGWREIRDLIVFYIKADRFLHGMVRTIAGTLLRSQELPEPENYLNGVFRLKNRESAFEAVPAKGLFLYKVEY